MASRILKPRKWGVLVLFASFSTLVCCALPILLVSLGMGAVMASLAANFPLLIALSQYKLWVFLTTASILILAGWALFCPGRTCPADPGVSSVLRDSSKVERSFLLGSCWSLGNRVFVGIPTTSPTALTARPRRSITHHRRQSTDRIFDLAQADRATGGILPSEGLTCN